MTRHTFLQLLTEEAPAVAYEDALRSALAAPGAGKEELLREYHLALLLRDRFDAQQARHQAQQALLSCAAELVEVTSDVDMVLTSIVTRAQQLLNCDLAYLSLNDADRSETYVRVMVGATTGVWRNVRIPFGVGVGGKVAETAAPFATSDYFHDASLAHDAEVDESARAEQQVAILGVPLIHRGHVIGVLYASNRTPGAFPQESVLLLSSFAALAAVAIERAQLLGDKEHALRDARRANAALEERTRATAREVAAHDRSMDLVLHGGGLQEVVDETQTFLGGCLVVVGELHAPIVWTDNTSDDRLKTMIAAARNPRRSKGRSDRVEGCWVTSLTAGNEAFGALVWAPGTPIEDTADADLRLLERTAVVAALLQLFTRSLAAAEARVRGDLLDDLLDGSSRANTSLDEQAQRLGCQLQTPHTVLATHVSARDLPLLSAATAEVAASRNGLSTVRDGFAVLTFPSSDSASVGRQVARSLTHRLGAPVTVGAAGPATDPADFPRAYSEAAACAQALLRLERAGDSATVQELGYTGLLLGGTATASGFVDRTIGPLIRQDEQRATQLLATLEAYFATGRSPARSANQLHVHPNTVTQRLDRIRRLLDFDWSDADRTLDVQLALRLYRVLRPHLADCGQS